MLYTQLFRGPTKVAPYPSYVFEELFKLQNVQAEPETAEITIPDPSRIGLPELDGVTSVTAINVTGEAVNLSPAAMAVLMYGSTEKVPSGTVDGETQEAYVDRTIRLANIPLVVSAVKSADGTTTYTRGVDYVVTAGGIRIQKGGALAGAINASAAPSDGGLKRLPIDIDYTYPTVDVVKLFTQSRRFYRLMFEQVNEGGDGEKRRVTCFYARISLNGALPLNQAGEFGTVPVTLRLLSDPDITDTGEAAIWTMEVEDKDAA
ncbi:hypothetical protein [Pseudomonas sp. UBA6310]|uniref:phage tail tube protein n=1 Tax=Pseudomonas sp. UBA6310 TaxID=1947327 RepID=UPI0025807EC2|nr:hypothetical protein [Pseudomonas sp. UBA6310]